MKNRANNPADEPEDFYRSSIFIPLMDDVCSNLDIRFTSHTNKALMLNNLIPSNCCDIASTVGLSDWLEDSFTFYSPVINKISSLQFAGEWDVWRKMWENQRKLESVMPNDALSALEKCDRQPFPTIMQLLQICATIPVSTATPERTFSNLRRLKTWLRNQIGQDRLTGLALMALHQDKISTDHAQIILDRFCTQKSRRLGLVLN